MKKFGIIVSLAFFLMISSVFKVGAQELPKNNIDIEFLQNGTGRFSLELSLIDKGTANYFAGFELTLPFKNIRGITSKINEQLIIPQVEPNEVSTKLVFEAERLSIDIDEDAYIQLVFEADDIYVERFGIKYLYIPEFNGNFDINEIKYSITYPQDFGEVSFVSSRESVNVDNKLEFNSFGGALAVWGTQSTSNVEMNYFVENKDEEDKVYLLNTLSNVGQKVRYSDLTSVSGALSDKWENNYFVYALNPKEKGEFQFKASIEKETTDSFVDLGLNYGWSFKTDNQLVKDYLSEIADETDNYNKLEALNDLLVNRIDPYVSGKVNINLLSNIWAKIDGRTNLNAFEYCYLLIAGAEYLGYNANLHYGYLILPNIFTTGAITPHVWCEVKAGEEVFFFDPFVEDISKAKFYGRNATDRLLMGTWHPNQDYNNMLGLLSQESDEVQIKFTDIPQDQKEQKVTAKLSIPDSIYSKEPYSGEVVVVNDSDFLVPVKDIIYRGASLISQIKVREFYPLLLPRKETSFTLDNLVVNELILSAEEEISVKVNTGNFNYIYNTNEFTGLKKVQISTSISFILTFLIGLIIFIALSIFLIKLLLSRLMRLKR